MMPSEKVGSPRRSTGHRPSMEDEGQRAGAVLNPCGGEGGAHRRLHTYQIRQRNYATRRLRSGNLPRRARLNPWAQLCGGFDHVFSRTGLETEPANQSECDSRSGPSRASLGCSHGSYSRVRSFARVRLACAGLSHPRMIPSMLWSNSSGFHSTSGRNACIDTIPCTIVQIA